MRLFAKKQSKKGKNMNIFVADVDSVIYDGTGKKTELLKHVPLVLESGVSLCVQMEDIDFVLFPVKTYIGRVAVGLRKSDMPLDVVLAAVEKVVLQFKKYPKYVKELASKLTAWTGKRIVGVSSTPEEHRLFVRKMLSPVALEIINIGQDDLYVFPPTDLPAVKYGKLAVSEACGNSCECVRQALVVERYAVGSGLLRYGDFFEYDVHISVERGDISTVRARLCSSSVEEFADKLKIGVEAAYKEQLRVEKKYLLMFDMGIDCYLFSRGVSEMRTDG